MRPPQGEASKLKRKSDLKAARRIEVQLKPERGGAGEAQHHGFAARGGETLLHRLAHQLGAVAVGRE